MRAHLLFLQWTFKRYLNIVPLWFCNVVWIGFYFLSFSPNPWLGYYFRFLLVWFYFLSFSPNTWLEYYIGSFWASFWLITQIACLIILNHLNWRFPNSFTFFTLSWFVNWSANGRNYTWLDCLCNYRICWKSIN